MPQEAVDADMRKYVYWRVRAEKFQRQNDLGKHPEELESVSRKVLLKSEHQFLMAKLSLDELEGCDGWGKFKKAIKNLPVNTHDRYESTVERVRCSRIFEASLSLGMIVLGFIHHAKRSLSVEDLRHALAALNLHDDCDSDDEFSGDDAPNENTIVASGQGLFNVTPDRKIEFVHSTLHEFLRRNSAHATELDRIHGILTQTCINYMSLPHFSEPVEDRGARSKEYPFLLYASDHFGQHASVCAKKDKTTLLGYLDFVKTRMPMGVWQEMAAKVLQNPSKDRIRAWRNEQSDLHLAVVVGFVEAVAHLVEGGADVNKLGFKEETPLHMAARSANTEAAVLLIEHDANVHATNYSGKNALDMIMNEQYLRVQLEAVKPFYIQSLLILLLTHVAHGLNAANKVGDETSNESISDAPKVVKKDFSEYLGSTRTQPSTKLTQYVLAKSLKSSLTDRQSELALELVRKGIDVNAKETDQPTPLQLAVIYKQKELVMCLMDKGANAWLDTTMGYNAIQLAEMRKDVPGGDEILQIMRSKTDEILSREHAASDDKMKLSELQIDFLPTSGIPANGDEMFPDQRKRVILTLSTYRKPQKHLVLSVSLRRAGAESQASFDNFQPQQAPTAATGADSATPLRGESMGAATVMPEAVVDVKPGISVEGGATVTSAFKSELNESPNVTGMES
ncbi:hypothetical protein ACHAQH_005365 [Verticillium albo-atrum]